MVLDIPRDGKNTATESPIREHSDDPEELLSRFPHELVSVWEKKIEGKPLAEQIALLHNGLQAREKTLRPKPYVSDRLMVVKAVPEELIEAMREIEERSVEFDRGRNGRLVHCIQPSTKRDIAYKLLLHPPVPPQNDLISEAAYLADIHALSRTNKELRIGVPRPLFYVSEVGIDVLAQEKIVGSESVKNILEKKIPVPSHIDLEMVFERLSQFVDCIHAAGYYHRDLREGNIMINLNPNGDEPHAYIVDMGYCTKAASEEAAHRDVDAPKDHAILAKVKDSLIRYKERQENV